MESAIPLLMIDDDLELGGLVQCFMAGEGYRMEIAANGRQGIQAVLTGKFKLIVLDVMMPDIGGFDVLRRIRSESRTPVLMLTAKGETRDRVLGLELGVGRLLAQTVRAGGTGGADTCDSAACQSTGGRHD
jgi:two-component system OmpR family response regulator